MIQFDLSRHEKTWRGAFETEYVTGGHSIYRTRNEIALRPGRAVVFLAAPFQFPPLEDFHQDDFWKEVQKELKDSPEGLSFDFRVEFLRPWIPGMRVEDYRASLTERITINLRNDREMELIEQWYHNTPKKFLPRSAKEFPKIIPEDKYHFKISAPFRELREGSIKKILGHSPWCFITIGNRYPSDPNVPETWQGWKELEESIAPSTMRDEIRLTRFLIQYCDTKDEKVLEELKKWFDAMNEIQRAVMAKSVRDRAFGSFSSDGRTNLAPLLQKVHKTIREYDTVPIPRRTAERMKALGLIE
jgi:hypothetical protein